MSTGLECEIIERRQGECYYILQDWHCPVGAWDWREYATCYGPFPSLVRATEHLRRNHANPGGWSTHSLEGGEQDPVLENLFERAIK